jgi:hypothetical protein
MAIAPKVGCAQIRFGVGLSNPKLIAASKKDSFACTRIAVALASLWNLAWIKQIIRGTHEKACGKRSPVLGYLFNNYTIKP